MEKQRINGRNYLIWEDVARESVEHFEIEMLEQNDIAGFFPFSYVHLNARESLQYLWESGVSLEEWLQEIHTKKEILSFLKSLTECCLEAEAWMLDDRKLDFSTDEIAVDGKSGACRMAYFPLKDYGNDGLHNMVKRCLERILYDRKEDFFYIFDLQNAYSRGVIQEKEDLLRWIQNEVEKEKSGGEAPFMAEQPKQYSSIHAAEQTPLQNLSPIQEKAVNKEEKKEGKKKLFAGSKKKEKEVLPLPEGMLLPENMVLSVEPEIREKAGNAEKKKPFSFGGKEKERKKGGNQEAEMPIVQEPPQPIKVQVKEEISDTVYVGETTKSKGQVSKAQLQNHKTAFVYQINREVLTIGADEQRADLCIKENRAVSRAHARIEKRGDQYYIEDAGSKNGTFLDGKRLEPGTAYLLKNRMVIAFANEEFTFCMAEEISK